MNRLAAQNLANKVNMIPSGAGTNSGTGSIKKQPKVSSSSMTGAELNPGETAANKPSANAPSDQPIQNPSSNKQSANPNTNRAFRHYSNCPLFYLNIANRPTHHQHPHHHASGSGVIGTSSGGGHHKASFYHIPNLFQNSFQVPLHFRNVYYYKSLLNLNMRLVVLRPHGAGALTLKSSGAAPATLGFTPGHHHHHHAGGRTANHHHHHHNQHNIFGSAGVVSTGQNNVSLSCPDLNLKQLLIVKKPKRDDKSATGVATITDGTFEGALVPIGILNFFSTF